MLCSIPIIRADMQNETFNPYGLSVDNKSYSVECDKCEYVNSRKYDVNLHINEVHSKTRAIHCPECDYQTTHSTRLAKHISSQHS